MDLKIFANIKNLLTLVTGVKAKTDLIPAAPASNTEVETTSLATGAGSVATTVRLGLLVRWAADWLNDKLTAARAGYMGFLARMASTTIDLAQIAATYDLFTGATQDVEVEALIIRLPNVNVSDDVNITSISIQTDDATPFVFVSTAQGAKANLTAEVQIPWTGSMLLKVGKKIQLTIAGGAADAATVCDVVVKYRTKVEGGTL